MNTNPFEIVEMNGKRLKMDLSLICKGLSENDIVDIYAMRIARRCAQFEEKSVKHQILGIDC